jgi:hypothetical protein
MKMKDNKQFIQVTSITAFLLLIIASIFFLRNIKLNKTFQNKKFICNILSPKETARIHKINNPLVKIIWNGSEGLWDKQNLQNVKLTHDLTIGGNENDPNTDFLRVVGVYADREENIYINELFEGTIRKYDKNGKYISTIGRKGQGPGEFSGPNLKITFDKNNKLIVYDYGNNRISQFNRNGEFLNSFNLAKSASNPSHGFAWSDSGDLYLSFYENSTETVIHKYNHNGQLLSSFGAPARFIQPEDFNNFSIKESISKGRLKLVNNMLIFSQKNPYEIRFYDLQDNLQKVIYRKNNFMPPEKIEITGVDSYKSSVSVTSTMIGTWKNFIIHCVAVPPHMNAGTGCIIDLLNFDGNLLKTFYLKESIYFFHIGQNGNIYGVIADYYSYQKVVRYALTY